MERQFSFKVVAENYFFCLFKLYLKSQKMLAVKKFLFYYQSNPHRRGKLRSPNNSAFIMKKFFERGAKKVSDPLCECGW